MAVNNSAILLVASEEKFGGVETSKSSRLLFLPTFQEDVEGLEGKLGGKTEQCEQLKKMVTTRRPQTAEKKQQRLI